MGAEAGDAKQLVELWHNSLLWSHLCTLMGFIHSRDDWGAGRHKPS